MTENTHESDVFSYHAKRFPLAIDVSIVKQEVRWRFRWMGNQWREQLPLHLLIPYPTISVDRRSYRVAIPSAIFGMAWIGGILYFFGLSATTLLISLLIAIVVFAMLGAVVRRGPIEWASFESLYPSKTIYFFRNGEDKEFDAFVDHLRNAIIAAAANRAE